MTTPTTSDAVAVFNRTLAADVSVVSKEDFKTFWTNVAALNKGIGDLDEDAFKKLIARLAFGNIPDTVPLALDKLMELEAAAAEAEAVPRQRKARSGVADTPFVVPDLFRAYKRIIKTALTLSVELLDAHGYPLGKREVLAKIDEVKDEAKSDKLAIDKLTQCSVTFLAILAKCDQPVDKAAVEAIRESLTRAMDEFIAGC